VQFSVNWHPQGAESVQFGNAPWQNHISRWGQLGDSLQKCHYSPKEHTYAEKHVIGLALMVNGRPWSILLAWIQHFSFNFYPR